MVVATTTATWEEFCQGQVVREVSSQVKWEGTQDDMAAHIGGVDLKVKKTRFGWMFSVTGCDAYGDSYNVEHMVDSRKEALDSATFHVQYVME